MTLPTTTKQPTISNAEVDRMMKEFAEPAMSERVTIRTDAAHSIDFGSLSLPKILGFKAVDGKLVETYDLKALKEAYGTTFMRRAGRRRERQARRPARGRGLRPAQGPARQDGGRAHRGHRHQPELTRPGGQRTGVPQT